MKYGDFLHFPGSVNHSIVLFLVRSLWLSALQLVQLVDCR